MAEIPSTIGGLRAIQLSFRPMREISSGRSVSYLSRTQLNTPELGTLMPETFRPAAEYSGQSKKLFQLELLQLAEAIDALTVYGKIFHWISLDMPLSILKDPETPAELNRICEQFTISPNKFCFAIPEAVMAETDTTAADQLARLRRRGYHMMLTGFGESGCPFMKLSELAVDHVLLSPGVIQYLGRSERSDQAVHSIISFVNDLQSEPVADGVKSSAQAESLYEFGCTYCTGPLSGDYLTLEELTQ